MSARVLVTDGTERSALAAVRSLGRAGHQVAVAAASARSLAAASRWSRAEFMVPEALRAADAFATAIADIARAQSFDVVLPVTDASTAALLGCRAALGSAQLPCGSAAAFARVSDKALVTRMAGAAGICVPQQVELPDPAALAGLTTEFPVVIKPARSVFGEGTARRKLSVQHAANRQALEHVVAALPASAFPVLVQQRIVGPGVGVFMLVWQGRLLAAFVHRRLREKPPAGGVSVYAISAPPEPELIDRSQRLVESLGWEGVAMVEYKRDARTGRPYLMEINGRLWGSLQLAVDAGVDFPALLIAAARGESVTPVRTWHVGVRSRWLWGDIDHLLTRLRRSSAALSLPRSAPGRLATIAGFVATTLRLPRDQVFRVTDPAPFVRETLDRLGGT